MMNNTEMMSNAEFIEITKFYASLLFDVLKAPFEIIVLGVTTAPQLFAIFIACCVPIFKFTKDNGEVGRISLCVLPFLFGDFLSEKVDQLERALEEK